MGRTEDWLGLGPKRLVYLEFAPGAGGDMFSMLAGSTSKGTFGFGKSSVNKRQQRLVASGLNLPDKRMISGIQFAAEHFTRIPVMQNYIQTMLISAVGLSMYANKDHLQTKQQFWDALANSHTIWAAGHPGGNMLEHHDRSWVSAWRQGVESIGWSYLPVHVVCNSYDSFLWTCCIAHSAKLADQTHETVEPFIAKQADWIDTARRTVEADTLQIDFIQMVLDNKPDELLAWIKQNINQDINESVYYEIFENYRDMRYQHFLDWKEKFADRLDFWKETYYNKISNPKG